MHLVFKALHLIFMVTWFAGLFYMFRLFVYHVEKKDKPDVVATLKTMSHKLYYYITWPGMVLTLTFGFSTLLQVPHYMTNLWMQGKLILILLLIGYHLFIGYTLKRFKKDDVFLSSKQCRILNEVPVFMLIGIVLFAVFRPI